MNLKNYTSTVPASRSVELIERLLVSIGATNINKSYKDGKLTSMSFQIDINNSTIPFRLPAKVKEVEEYLIRQRVKYVSHEQKEKIKDQAERTAWKIIYEWVVIQVSMIQLKQAEFIEVFLPYVYNAKKEQTFFELIKEQKYSQLLALPKTENN